MSRGRVNPNKMVGETIPSCPWRCCHDRSASQKRCAKRGERQKWKRMLREVGYE